MPEDYQSLFAELTGTTDPVANPTTPVAEQAPDATANPAATPEATPATPSAQPDAEVKPIDETPKEDPSAKAFAEMRAKTTKYQRVFSKLQEALKVENEDEVIEKLLGQSYETLGKRQNTDPVVLKRLSELEEVNNSLIQERQMQFVTNSFNKVKSEFNLSDAELTKFAQHLASNNVDILASNVDLSALYRGINHEAITSKLLETEKQKWIKEQMEAEKAPAVNPATGKRDPNPKKEINSMSDLELALKSLS